MGGVRGGDVSLDALWGLAAILNDNVVIVGGRGAIIANVTTWGWIHRVLGIVFVTVNVVAQIVWFPAAPLWAFLMIILGVTIVSQLTARWGGQAGWNN